MASAPLAKGDLQPLLRHRCPLRAAQCSAASHRTQLVVVASGKGFDGKATSTSSKKKPKIARYLGVDEGLAAGADPALSGWTELKGVDATTCFLSKPIKPVILANNQAICLYKVDDRVYCTDAASPAYKYPLADANLLSLKTGPAVESPLDGSVFDLASGRVLSWCPKNNALRSVLGALKDKAEPADLKTFPVEVKGGAVYVKLG